MRRSATLLTVTVALLGSVHPAPAQTEIELRAATTEYRFADLSYTHQSGLLLDAVYVGFPGVDQLFLGAGYEFDPTPGTCLIPILYGVSGNDTRGVTLGGLISLDGRRWHLEGFFGHFFRSNGDVPDYTFVDTLDVTRAIGRWEVGVSADAFAAEGEVAWLAGPTLKRHDELGAWALSARFGDEQEIRLTRKFDF